MYEYSTHTHMYTCTRAVHNEVIRWGTCKRLKNSLTGKKKKKDEQKQAPFRFFCLSPLGLFRLAAPKHHVKVRVLANSDNLLQVHFFFYSALK